MTVTSTTKKAPRRRPSQEVALARIEEMVVGIRRDLEGDRESRRVMHEKIDVLTAQNAKQDETISLAGVAATQLRDVVFRVDADLTDKITALATDIKDNVKPTVKTMNAMLSTGRGIAWLMGIGGLSIGVIAMAAWEGARHVVGSWLAAIFH